MECPRCHSHRVVKFIDAFGVRRIFCRDCWLSVPEQTMVKAPQLKISTFVYKPEMRVPHPPF